MQPDADTPRYEIVRQLGEGGMAEVFLARDNIVNRLVALKMPKLLWSDTDVIFRRFRREAEYAEGLVHPNICRVYGTGRNADGRPYMTMEYIDGVSLDKAIARRELMPREAFVLIAKILDGLADAHRKGVVHRDLKPANIMLRKSGEPVIMDFGLALRPDRSRLSQPGEMMGTPLFMSPEQLDGSDQIGPASDIYSMGVMIYRVFAGRFPFGNTMEQVKAALQGGHPPEPTSIDAILPKQIDIVCLRALQSKPEDRYSNAEQLQTAFLDLEAAWGPVNLGMESSVSGQATDRQPASSSNADRTLLQVEQVVSEGTPSVDERPDVLVDDSGGGDSSHSADATHTTVSVEDSLTSSDIRKEDPAEASCEASSGKTLSLYRFKIVIAVDFGSSHSGYAFAFPGQRPVVDHDWPGQPYTYGKTLTALLRSKDEVLSWGFPAHLQLAQLRDANQGRDVHLIERIKIAIANTSGTTPVMNVGGKSYSVIELIADYLRELRQYALSKIRSAQTMELADEDIRWCLTVPAIWSDAQKQWMRQAAQRAGMISHDPVDSSRLVLALEPEAAAIYCLDQEQLFDSGTMQPGVRFMVVDAGGGTVDITVHEVRAGAIEEVVPAGGGMHGSQFVDSQFFKSIDSIFAPGLMRRFQQKLPSVYLEFVSQWERQKRFFNPELPLKFVRIPIPRELYTLMEEYCPQQLAAFVKSQDGDAVQIRIPTARMRSFFDLSLDGIVGEMHKSLRNCEEQRCDFLFLVGGYSESSLLNDRLRKEFEGKYVGRIIRPRDPGFAVVAGAALFGLNPSQVRARRARFSYGCAAALPFKEAQDPESKRQRFEGFGDMCVGRFCRFVRAGDRVATGFRVKRSFGPKLGGQKSIRLEFFASLSGDVRYVDEPGVFRVAELRVPLTEDAIPGRELDVELQFGDTEIHVSVTVQTTGETLAHTFEFFGTYFPEQVGRRR